jgi:hypothetical protein
MGKTASRAFATLPLSHWTYLGNPQSIFSPVNFHDLVLDLDQLTDRLQQATPTVLLVGLGQSGSRSQSRNRNRVLDQRRRVGQRVTLGARGYLPSGYIVSSLWVLKPFAQSLPTRYFLGTF